jgi:SAM-dependent methyltransferase
VFLHATCRNGWTGTARTPFRDCLRSLRRINRWLLGYRPTLAWLDGLPRDSREPIHIVDVGSGGGDLRREIAKWCRKRGIAVKLTGIDLNPHVTRAATTATSTNPGISWATGDAMHYPSERKVDVVVSSLRTHHLENEEIVALLRWLEATVRIGWFLNDLERSAWSLRMFRWVRWYPMVRHDGPVSFRRAFRRDDCSRLRAAAAIPLDAVTVEHWRPGRLCLSRWKRGNHSEPSC